MRFSLKETCLGLRNSVTRIPFRYGATCLTACPQAVLEVLIEVGTIRQKGYSGDCLPPGWFDKSPGKTFAEQIDDMLASIRVAQEAFAREADEPTEFFEAWFNVYRHVHERAESMGINGLTASFAVSLVERAVMDGLARAAGLPFHEAIRRNLYDIRPETVHPELAGLQPADWIPNAPTRSIFVRHTVGLGDPLTVNDIQPDERLDDGFPQALEEYVQRTGIRYFKVKVSNQLEHDRQRLLTIAAVVEKHLGSGYKLTLDGNEQYKRPEQFDELIETLRSMPGLEIFMGNILAVEQPLDRSISLDPRHTGGIRELSKSIPVILDESDAHLTTYAEALAIGYRGVSSKNCKGAVKSVLNAGLTWLRNDRGQRADYLMTGEDLCSVGILPTQSDLCLVATLGLDHIERNGHHYHPGLTYLPENQRRAAIAAHPDFYAEIHGRITPNVQDGRFEIGSLQCPGYGFAVEPDLKRDYQSPEAWSYESLGV